MPSLDPDTLMRLVYLVVLLVFVAGFFFAGRRGRTGRALRDLAIWALIFAMVVIAYGFRDVLREELMPAAMVEIDPSTVELRRGSDGHFHATLEINGQPVRFLVDTGASEVVLAHRDAERIGLNPEDLDFSGSARTANGMIATAPLRLASVRFGSFADSDVPASVSTPALDTSLLGMSYLNRFSKIEISGDRMRLVR